MFFFFYVRIGPYGTPMIVMLEQHSCKRDVPFCDQDAPVLNIHARVCEISSLTIISKSLMYIIHIWEEDASLHSACTNIK